MFRSSYLAEAVTARTTPFSASKNYQVSEPTLIDNVCVIGYNRASNFAKSTTFFNRFGGYLEGSEI